MMSVFCQKCNKTFKSNSGLASHIRFSKSCGSLYNKGVISTRPKSSLLQRSNRVNLNDASSSSLSPSQLMIAKNEPRIELKNDRFKQDIDVPKEPTEEEFSSSWLEDYQENSEKETNDATTTDENFFNESNNNNSQLDSTFTLSTEQYKAFFIMLNDTLDTLITLAGGEETFNEMKDATLDNLAISTKNYADSIQFQLSPAKMLMVSIGLAYSIPTTKALKSIRTNRKRLRAVNSINPDRKLKKDELEKLQNDVKIDFLDGSDE